MKRTVPFNFLRRGRHGNIGLETVRIVIIDQLTQTKLRPDVLRKLERLGTHRGFLVE